jgi:hypothetical protein
MRRRRIEGRANGTSSGEDPLGFEQKGLATPMGKGNQEIQPGKVFSFI